MQPTRVKSSFAEDVKLLSNVLPLLSVFFSFWSCVWSCRCWKAAMAARQHVLWMLNICSQVARCTFCIHSSDSLYLQVTGLTRLQGVKLRWREAHQWSLNISANSKYSHYIILQSKLIYVLLELCLFAPPKFVVSITRVIISSWATGDNSQYSSQAEYSSLWLVNWSLCVKSVKFPFKTQ